MKEKRLGSKILIILLALAVLLYFGLQVVGYFGDPLRTAMAYTYRVEESTELAGVIVRNEMALEDDANGLLQLHRDEGERVSRSGIIASVYADQAAMDQHREIETAELRVQQLEYARDVAVGAEASVKLDAQILRNMRAVRCATEEDRLAAVSEYSGELRALVLKRDYNPDDAVDLDAQLKSARQELKQLKTQVTKSTRRIRAPRAGLYSAVVDGYEKILTPEVVEGMKPSQLAALKPVPDGRSHVGKLILGEEWLFAAPVTAEEAQSLKKRSENGEKLGLRFAKNIEQRLPVKLDSLGPEENGRCLAIFRGKTNMPQLTQLRQQKAKLVSVGMTGIRIPKEALHASGVYEEEKTGKRKQVNETGIYCVVGKEACFKPVEVVYNGDGFLLVKSTAEEEKDRLRSGDAVIVTANDLYHGKVVG